MINLAKDALATLERIAVALESLVRELRTRREGGGFSYRGETHETPEAG